VDASSTILRAHIDRQAVFFEVAVDFFRCCQSAAASGGAGKWSLRILRNQPIEPGKDKDRAEKPDSPRQKGPDMPDWMRSLIRSLKDEEDRKKKDSD